MMLGTSHNRAIRLIRDCIKRLRLNLRGYQVLTEVGSNTYLYTPIIAAMAGADRVYAWTADTHYGPGAEIRKNCLQLAAQLGLNQKIEISVNERPRQHLALADIITNSGFLRPIDRGFLKTLKQSAVVPLMYEAWELRAEDIDIEFCRERSIRVAGTWENHPAIRVFDSTGTLAVKLANEAGFEVLQNRIIVWSNDSFGEMACAAFRNAGAESVLMTTEWTQEVMSSFAEVDFIYICDYSETRPFFGPGGIFDLEQLMKVNDSFSIVHLYGDVDNDFLKQRGIGVFPDRRGRAHQMTFTLGHLGPRPIVNLQVAGFKVAQEMLENNLSDLSQPISFK